MRRTRSLPLACLAAATFSFTSLLAQAQEPVGTPGERLPASAISPLVVETMAAVVERDRANPPDTRVRGVWDGQDGRWFVPPITAQPPAHSGEKAIVNEWGDPRMAIGFPGPTDVREVWAAGHGGAAAKAVRFLGQRGGEEVAATGWLPLGAGMQRCALAFAGIDRLVVELEPASGRQGWVALDDLALAVAGASVRTLDFEDLQWRQVLTGTAYAGLSWEAGSGLRGGAAGSIVPAPQAPAGAEEKVVDAGAAPQGVAGTSPSLWLDFLTARQGDAGANLIPPDTCGAAGRDHFVSITNSNLSVYDKATGTRSLSVSLLSFFPGSSGTVGDPRIVWDPHHGRFVALATNFSGSATIYIAYSATTDPNGTWFKFSFQTNLGTDAGKWPDYPTLGVDVRGIYTSAYMVGGTAGMTIWAIDKAPLLTNPPTLGTITAFRALPYEGCNQACTTYGDPGGEYVVSRRSSTQLRLRRVAPPLTAPTLVEVASPVIPSHSTPPTASALGSTTGLNAIDARPMNAVYRNGSVWCIHNIGLNGRVAVRWYQIDAATGALQQTGTVSDALWNYLFGAIAVDAANNVAIGCSGSHANAYASTFYCGRLAGDPPGVTSAPVMYKAGEGPWNRLDGSGRNRFGDYSFTTVDPVDDVGFWTIQEYILPGNLWATRTARIGYEAYNYGVGLAGTTGVPGLRATARPAIGRNLLLEIGNSVGAGTVTAVLVIGTASAAAPIFGGTLHVTPLLALPISVASPVGTQSIPVPNAPEIALVPIYFQVGEADAGAVQGISLTPGLVVRPGSR